MSACPYSFAGNPKFRLALTLLCLTACFVQSLVAQTHWHGQTIKTSAPVAAFDAALLENGADPASSSSQDHHRKGHPCVLCQVVLRGSGLAPLTSSLPQISLSTPVARSSIEISLDVVITAISYSWKIRGPPLP